MNDILKINCFFDFYGADYSINKVNGWYYFESKQYNNYHCKANTIEGLLQTVIHDLNIHIFL